MHGDDELERRPGRGRPGKPTRNGPYHNAQPVRSSSPNVGHLSSILQSRTLYDHANTSSNGTKLAPARPSSGGKVAVRVGCVLGIRGALQLGQEPLHAALRPDR